MNSAHKIPFRANDWWQGKAALLMGAVYLFALWFRLPFLKFIPLALLSLITIIGFAGFGYFVNDFLDVEQDALVGKKNSIAGKPISVIILLFLTVIFFIVLPWFCLPNTWVSFSLIAFQILLLLSYSIPPFRLKERGVLGIITDALYAHAVPTVLAAYTFSLVENSDGAAISFLLLFAWQFTSGVRNILLHQEADKIFDKRSGTETFVASMPFSGFLFSLRGLIVWELFLSFSFIVSLTYLCHLLWFAVVILLISLCWFLNFMFKNGSLVFFQSSKRFFPNVIFDKWFPLLFLSILSVIDIHFLILFFIHSLLFNFSEYMLIFDAIIRLWKSIPFRKIFFMFYIPMRYILSFIINYTIYYAFRIMGIDLKKQNSSAAQYLKSKFLKE